LISLLYNKQNHYVSVSLSREEHLPILILVVNGKEKKIGKKSQYLLDMMIIEE